MIKGNAKLMKMMNQEAILKLLLQNGTISRSEIATRMALSKSSVSMITQELLDSNIVQEVGDGTSHVGRKPILLKLNESRGYAIGIDLSSYEQIRLVTCNNKGEILQKAQINYDSSEDNLEQIVLREVRELINKAQYLQDDLIGIGISMPGILDKRDNLVKHAINFKSNKDFTELFKKEFKVPVALERPTNLGLIAHHELIASNDTAPVVFIAVGTGIGAGLLLDGKIYNGAIGSPGELGHMTIDHHGELCKCGKRGCIEAYSSEISIIKKAVVSILSGEETILRKHFGENQFKWSVNNEVLSLDFLTILEAAQMKDALALRLLRDAMRHLGIAIANVVNFLNPKSIILFGRIFTADQDIVSEVYTSYHQQVIEALSKNTDIYISKLDEDTFSRGAAMYLIRQSFFQFIKNKIKENHEALLQ